MTRMIGGMVMRWGLTLVAMFVLLGPAVCQEQGSAQGTSEAKVEFDKAETARKKGDFKTAVDHYRRAIELDPDNTDAHEYYIFTSGDVATNKEVRDAVFSGKATPEQRAEFKKQREENSQRLKAEYGKLAEEHPAQAGYQWALGDLNMYDDPKAAIRYFEASLKINPKFAPGYQSLSLMDEIQGDLDGMRENLHRAVDAAPNDPKYLFDYAYAFHHSDPKEFTRLSLEVVNRFPDSERAAQALFWLAESTPTESEKLHYLEMLRDDQAPAAQDWKGGGLAMLFDIYMKSDPAKAYALAKGLIKKYPDDSWKSFATYAKAIGDADRFLKRDKAGKALKALEKVKLPKWYDREHHLLVLTRARALNANKQPKQAYDALLQAYATAPNDEIHTELVSYGKELGKNVEQVDGDVWDLQVKNSSPAEPFSLPSYTSDKPMSLDDFRGRVILLNFWYPLCGPCRGEFPYIQAVLDKYKDQGFDIVAVNVLPTQDELVLPLLKGFKLGFIPLKGSEDFAETVYKVRGEPTNFLIGANGRIYFGPLHPISSPESQRTLELQVEALLRAKQAEKESKPAGDHPATSPVGSRHD